MNTVSCLPSHCIMQSHYLKRLFCHTTPDCALEHAVKHDLDKYAGEHLIVFMYQLSVLMYVGTGQRTPKL